MGQSRMKIKIHAHASLSLRLLSGFFIVAIVFTLSLTLLPPESASAAGWYDSTWLYRKAITIDYTKVANSNQTDFPVLINLTTDADLAAHARSDGYDILFTDSTGTVKIPYEREKYTTATGELVAWVKVASLSYTTNTVLYMYYGKASATDQQQATSVWDSNYVGVWHLGEDVTDEGTAGSVFQDSTQNNKDLDQAGSVETTGKMGNAQSLDGTNDYMVTGTSPGVPTGDFTYSAWVNLTDNTDEALFMHTNGAGVNEMLVAVGTNTDGAVDMYTNDSVTSLGSGGEVGTGAWHYVVVARSGSTISGYNQGSVLPTTRTDGTAFSPSTCQLLLGADADATCIGTLGNYLSGIMDEARVSNTPRSADWIATEYNNQSSPGTFYTLGVEDDGTAPTPNPATFSSAPAADITGQISMTATTASDPSTPINYLFTFNACGANGGTGGTSSSWQTSTSYSDSGLQANKCYGYTTTSRDAALNAGTASSVSTAYTLAAVPGVPVFSDSSATTLTLTNTENGNPSASPTTSFAVQITSTSPTDNAWLNKWVDASGNPSATAVWLTDAQLDGLVITGLQNNTIYGAKSKARNFNSTETALGSEGTRTTGIAPTGRHVLLTGRMQIQGNVKFK